MPAHPVEVAGDVLVDVVELDGVEDGELGRPLVAVVAVAQEGRDVAVDEVVLDLPLEERLVDQAVDRRSSSPSGK